MARSRGATNRARRRPASRRDGGDDAALSRRLGGGALLAIAVLSLVSLLLGDGGAARDWNFFLGGAFGWGRYLLPILLGAFGLALLWPTLQPDYCFRRREAAGWLLLFGFFLTVFQLVSGNDASVLNASGGGKIGLWLAQFLDGLMGSGGAFSVAVIAGLLGAILATGLGPRELWAGTLVVLVVLLWLSKQLASGGRRLALLLPPAARRGLDSWQRWRTRERAAAPHFRINRAEIDDAPAAMPKEPKLRKSSAAIVSPPLVDGTPAASHPIRSTVPKVSASGDAARVWELPPLSLFELGGEGAPSESDIREKVAIIETTFKEFGIKAQVTEVNPGPVVTQFGLDPGYRERRDRAGNVVRRDKVKVSEITALRDDLALALAARTVRIEAPVPGRAVVGLEIPNSTATVVRLRKVIETNSFQRLRGKSKLAVALGQDVSGAAVAGDLAKMPHLLIAGATGSGKSVCMNGIVSSLLLHTTPDELRMVMIDPKRVELTSFRDVPHLLRSVVVDAEQAVAVLKWVMREMETRLKRFEVHGVRNIDGYNRLMGTRDGKEAMPYMVVLIDELADLMMTAPDEVERSICRLAQLARATGIHLVIATQRPSVDVVTGLIKANFPTRIAFAVASQVDSRTILDTAGAEQLLGSGDMLYMPADAAKPRRLQGAFVGDDEVKRLVEFWRSQGPPNYIQQLEEATAWSREEEASSDPLLERAVELAQHHTRVSASLLQRRLNVGYNRAAKLIDLLEERGVIGGSDGGKPREVLFPRDGDADSRED